MRSIVLTLGLLVLLPAACRKPDAAASSPPQATAVAPEPEPSAPAAEPEPAAEAPEPAEAPPPSLASQGETDPLRTVQPAKATVKGSMDADIIRRIVRAHINEVRYCYNEQLKVHPGLEGRVTVQFAIGPEGQVEVAAIEGIDPEHEGLSAVGECAREHVERWRFPKPGNGGRVVVTYPFVLAPG